MLFPRELIAAQDGLLHYIVHIEGFNSSEVLTLLFLFLGSYLGSSLGKLALLDFLHFSVLSDTHLHIHEVLSHLLEG